MCPRCRMKPSAILGIATDLQKAEAKKQRRYLVTKRPYYPSMAEITEAFKWRPGDQPRRPVGDDEQRVGLALDAMGRRRRSPRLPGVDVPGVDASMSPRPQPRRAMRSLDAMGRRDRKSVV